MQSQGKEFSEFFVGPARLRVISDGAADIATMVEAEKRVIHAFADRDLWRHEAVTLFILENLAPLVGQLRQLHGLTDQQAEQLPQRPMVNLYDLRNPRECFIFINLQVMSSEGYWNDALTAEGLLAHEHAHPVGECPATAAARPLRVTADTPAMAMPLLTQLGETLSTGALSELFANDICIANGFDAALAHICGKTIDRAVANLAQRPELVRRLAAAGSSGTWDAHHERLLLLLADAQAALPFSLEISPFFRTGQTRSGAALEDALRGNLLARMEPEVREMFAAIHDLFLKPHRDWDAPQVESWCREVLAMLSTAFSRSGERVVLRLSDDDSPAPSMRPPS